MNHSRTRSVLIALLSLFPTHIAAQDPVSAVNYRLSVRLRQQVPRLEVTGTLRLPSSTGAEQNLIIVLTESASSLRLEFVEGTGRATALSAEKQSGDDPPERRKWLVRLPSGNEGSDGFLKFSYVLEKHSEPIFHVSSDGAFAGGISTAWYPQLVGADASRLLAIGEIQFEVPVGQSVYASGKLIHSPSQIAARSFRFRLTEPVFISFANGPYRIQKHGKLSLYLLRERKGAISYLQHLEQVIKVLAGEFGPFPYENFALIEVQTEAARAAGFDGASLDGMMLSIGPYLDRPFNLAFYGHEIGHQWWGGVIRRKGSDGAYLMDEALAQWGSLRAVEAIAGREAAQAYRRVGYPGYYFEYSGFSFLRRSLQGFDHQLGTLPILDGTVSRRVANSKGMLVWDMLAATIGRDRFRTTLMEIVRKNWFRRMTWKDLWNAIESGAGKDLSWFYRQWLERTGAPSWRVSWHQAGETLRGSIEQGEPFYRLDLQVAIKGEECTRQVQTLRIDGARTEFEWRVPFQVSSIEVDPEYEILHWTEEYRRDAAALEPYTRGDLALLYGKSEQARALFSEALKSMPEPDPQGLRFLLEYGLGLALFDLEKLQESRTHLLQALTSSVKRPEVVPEVFVALADVATKSGDGPGLKAALRREQLAEQNAAQGFKEGNCAVIQKKRYR